MSPASPSSLPYHEPSIVELLVLSSFSLALNAVNAVLDRALYCGLVGQVLVGTRLGAVLSTAALMDDVVGLVMVRVVSELGEGGEDAIAAPVVLRPVLVSLAFAVGVPVACRVVLRPALEALRRRGWRLVEEGKERQMRFVVVTALLLALVAAASYAGASVLLAAYLAGFVVSWWDNQPTSPSTAEASCRGSTAEGSPRSDSRESVGDGTQRSADLDTTPAQRREAEPDGSSGSGPEAELDDASGLPSATAHHSDRQQAARYSGSDIYDIYYSQAVNRVLKPFFFASIGFSIPISKMFSGDVVWRGVIYSILMAIGKMFCGLWLVRFPTPISGIGKGFGSAIASRYRMILPGIRLRRSSPTPPKNETSEVHRLEPVTGRATETPARHPGDPTPSRGPQPSSRSPPAKPLSLYPSAIISFAMVARGEIGFLISAVAESKGIFRKPSDGDSDVSELFLIVTWAIVVCTIVGPLSVGVLVRRVKKLEGSGDRGSSKNVLGVWGVQ
ncbi:hypothetical protein F4779DRAFT_386840 [Xylariaceae sp. FL0662B]|nr:hypothetical protein F4779DRAFT_386840 [Xylariaceae sp. FL0662B]